MLLDYADELEADYHQYYNLDIYQMDRAKASRLLFQLPKDCRTYVKIEPSNQWGWEKEMLRHIMLWTHTLVWQNAAPAKKGEIGRWKRQQPELFTPPFMEKPTPRPKEQVVMDLDDMKALLNAPRV